MAIEQQYQKISKEPVNNNTYEALQDSLQEGKIQAAAEMQREQSQNLAILHNTAEMQARLAKLKDKTPANDILAFKNHKAIKHIS